MSSELAKLYPLDLWGKVARERARRERAAIHATQCRRASSAWVAEHVLDDDQQAEAAE